MLSALTNTLYKLFVLAPVGVIVSAPAPFHREKRVWYRTHHKVLLGRLHAYCVYTVVKFYRDNSVMRAISDPFLSM